MSSSDCENYGLGSLGAVVGSCNMAASSDSPQTSKVSMGSMHGNGGVALSSCSSNTTDFKAEGSIKLVISSLSNLRHKVTTSFHNIANLPWRLASKTECSKRTNNVKFFSVYIDCNPESESTLWSCEAVVEFRLHGQGDGVAHFTRQFTNKFNFNSNNWGFPSFMEWTDILNSEKGYVRNDRVIVEAHITVQRTRGVRISPSFDFSQPHPNCSDGVLVIDGVRLHVSKSYLALYSPVFSALFYGEFRERDLGEVPVEDVILEEFVEMLHVIYPSHKPVTAENVEFLLELGDKFEVQYVMEECEKYLTRTEEVPVITKLVWADQYGLARLQDVCIRTFKTTVDIKNLKTTEEYKNLSDTTKAALLEKMFKLILLAQCWVLCVRRGLTNVVISLLIVNCPQIFERLKKDNEQTVRSKLEYACQIWSPHQKYVINLIESVQRTYTTRLPGMNCKTYPERIRQLSIIPLELRRLHLDLTFI